MSGTFKYLDKAQGSDAAQSFLNSKLSNNKYTSGDPYAMGEGTTPSGSAYDDQRIVTNQAEIDDWNKANPNGGASKGGYVEGYNPTKADRNWEGTGKIEDFFSGEELEQLRSHVQGASGANDFGYTADTKNNWKETEDATSSGSIEAKMRQVGKHLGYEHSGTLNPDRVKDYIMRGEAETESAPKPEYETPPIEHSPEIQEAKDRVKTYEEDILSGKTSEAIYGKGEALADDKYQLDLGKGAAGISTSPDNKKQAAVATASFLDNKVSQVKKDYSFNPA
jgi:hypothetical protein